MLFSAKYKNVPQMYLLLFKYFFSAFKYTFFLPGYPVLNVKGRYLDILNMRASYDKIQRPRLFTCLQ